MKILVINGECVQTNTSANLCHLAYIRGLVDAGHEVTLLSADGRDYELDPSMEIPDSVERHTYYGVSLYEKMSLRKRQSSQSAQSVTEYQTGRNGSEEGKISLKARLVQKMKSMILASYGVHGIYATFVRKAQRFRSDVYYDYILSISTPVTSHLLAHNLLKAKHIKGAHWIQIWEDPWYSDAYDFNGKKRIRREEGRLLSFAEKVCYVSPLTLEKQQRLYPESAHKMYWQPLPYYYKAEIQENPVETAGDEEGNRYGYFGAYYPAARNLEPFYRAARETGIEVNICGDPSDLFPSTDRIHIYPRMSLNDLKKIEDKTNVLIFLCNRKGGQIPGKIYQYSATDKKILFILDGTKKEQKVLMEYFAPYHRYIFCQNTVEDISRAIREIEEDRCGDVRNDPVEDFNPQRIIGKILEGR